MPPITTKKGIKLFLWLGSFSLIFWNWSLEDFFLPRPAEIFYFLVAMLGFLYLFFEKREKYLKKIPSLVSLSIFLFFIFTIIATAIGYFQYDIHLSLRGFGHLIRLIWGIWLFVITFVILKESPSFYKKLYWSFLFPSLIYLPFIFSQDLARNFSMIDAGDRFRGFSDQPNMCVIFAFISFALVFCFFIDSFLKKKKFLSLIYLLLSSGLGVIILWTQSRAFVLALIASAYLSTILLARFYKKNFLKINIYVLSVIAIIIGMFLIMPNQMRETYFDRVTRTTRRMIDRPQSDARVVSTQYYLRLMKENPTSIISGFGLNYEASYMADWYGEAHGADTALDLFLNSGAFGLGAFILLNFCFLKNLKNRFNSRKKEGIPIIHYLGISSMLIGLNLAYILIGFPVYGGPFYWVLYAMVLV